MLQFGWKGGKQKEPYAPSDLLEHAKMAERASFDVIDITDHFHP